MNLKVFSNFGQVARFIARLLLVVEAWSLLDYEIANAAGKIAGPIARVILIVTLEWLSYEVTSGYAKKAKSPSSKGGSTLTIAEIVGMSLLFFFGVLMTKIVWTSTAWRFGLISFSYKDKGILTILSPEMLDKEFTFEMATAGGLIWLTPFLYFVTLLYIISSPAPKSSKKDDDDAKPSKSSKSSSKSSSDVGKALEEPKTRQNALKQAIESELTDEFGEPSVDKLSKALSKLMLMYMAKYKLQETFSTMVDKSKKVKGANFYKDDDKDSKKGAYRYLQYLSRYAHVKRDAEGTVTSSKDRDAEKLALYWAILKRHASNIDNDDKPLSFFLMIVKGLNTGRTKYDKLFIAKKDLDGIKYTKFEHVDEQAFIK